MRTTSTARSRPIARTSAERRGRGLVGAHDHRLERRQRDRDRVGHAERQEVGFRIRPEHAQRQRDEARGTGRAAARRHAACLPASRSSEASDVGAGDALVRVLGQRLTEHRVERGELGSRRRAAPDPRSRRRG